MRGYNRKDSKSFIFFGLDSTKSDSEEICNSSTNNYQNISSVPAINIEDVVEDDEVEEFYESDDDDEEDHEQEQEEDGSEGDFEEKRLEPFSREEEQELTEQVEPPVSFEPPDWILQKILTAELPRFIVDLLHLKLYVNSPQIENFMLDDSNEIALPILQLIFTLLHYPQPCHFQYLTRVRRISNVHYKKIESILLKEPFDPMTPRNLQIFEEIFENFERKNSLVMGLPENMRLFVLAMVYLSDKNSKVTTPFYHSLLIGLLLLSKADEDIQPVTRDPRFLHKKYGAVLDTVTPKQVTKDLLGNTEQNNEVESANMGQSITTNDSVFFLRNMLPLFQISDKIREKHTEFSSTIVHTFAEFQAIIFNLNCLNNLLNKPFQEILVSKAFNGTFLYNMYVNLRDRPNIEYYVRHHVFRDCEQNYHFYANVLNVCKSMILCLTDVGDKSKKGKATRNYRRNKRKQKLKTVGIPDEKVADEAFMDVESEDLHDGGVQFNDSNNKFSSLLNSR